MADKLHVFITSRVHDTVTADTGKAMPLKTVRQEICKRLEAAFDGKSIEVWLNEEEPAETDLDGVARCERWARMAHLVVAIVDGHPGAKTPQGVGICHLELRTAMDDSPQKVLLIRVDDPETERRFAEHADFRAYFDDLWSSWKKFGASAQTAEDIVEKAVQAVGHAVARMGRRILAEWRRTRVLDGEAFEWASKPFSERTALLVSRVVETLTKSASASVMHEAADGRPILLDVDVDKLHLLTTVTGVPDSFGVADARKYCGHPFRADSEHLDRSGSPRLLGPVHIIAVYKNVTEGQIRAHIGNADISIIKTDFGYWAQDRSTAIQVGYLTGLVDSGMVSRQTHRLLTWIGGSNVLTGIRELAKRRWRMQRRR